MFRSCWTLDNVLKPNRALVSLLLCRVGVAISNFYPYKSWYLPSLHIQKQVILILLIQEERLLASLIFFFDSLSWSEGLALLVEAICEPLFCDNCLLEFSYLDRGENTHLFYILPHARILRQKNFQKEELQTKTQDVLKGNSILS